MIQQTVDALRRWFNREPQQPPTVHDMDVDRRLSIRCLTDVETTCKTADGPDGEQYNCRVRDLSRGGVSLLLRAPVDSGTLLGVDFPGVEGQPPYTVLATVMHVTALPNGEIAAGCAFACELSEDDVQSFVSQRRPADAPPDKRGWVRFPCVTRATYRIVEEKPTEPEQARVQDISPSGIGMVMSRRVEVGTLVTLELPGVRDETVVTVLASVARTSAGAGDDWVVGCTFSRELTDQEMQTLV